MLPGGLRGPPDGRLTSWRVTCLDAMTARPGRQSGELPAIPLFSPAATLIPGRYIGRTTERCRTGDKSVVAEPGGWDNLLVRKADITADLVSQLVASQFPRWAGLPVRPVEAGGWDNATFRLGEQMLVRLPSAQEYAPAVSKEQRWLPVLAAQLPLPVPKQLAVGVPGCDFPWPWSVCRWIDGAPITEQTVPDLPQFAADLAGFLAALYQVDPAGGPRPGPHNFFRGGPLTVYDGETQQALDALEGHIDTGLAAEVWQAALRSTWPGRPVWFHGDAQPGNLLAKDGRLCAVIDFGTCGVGDPACDTTIAWTFLSGQSSRVFKERLPVDSATWARGRGWAIWKAMKVLVGALDHDPEDAAFTAHVIGKIMADHLADR
jgi:aminoglycoside phosphotransferase (APT) family kinase protein